MRTKPDDVSQEQWVAFLRHLNGRGQLIGKIEPSLTGRYWDVTVQEGDGLDLQMAGVPYYQLRRDARQSA